MAKYVAICPHDSGMFQAREIEVEADSVIEVHTAIWRELVGGRYLSRILKEIDGKWVQVWHEGQTLVEHIGE